MSTVVSQPAQPSTPISPSQMPHRQTGFRVQSGAHSPRSAHREDMTHFGSPQMGIDPLSLHSPASISPEYQLSLGAAGNGMFDMGSPSNAMQHLDIMGSLHDGSGAVDQGRQSVPRYYVAPQQSAAPHEIFSAKPESHQAGFGTVADDLAGSLHSPRSALVDVRRAGSSGKAPSASLQARNARRFSVSSPASSPVTKTEVSPNGPMPWFDQPVPSHESSHTPGAESELNWSSPLPSAAIDMGHIQPQAVLGRPFMPSSAPATSSTFMLGRAPGGRLRSESNAPTIPSGLSDVGEEEQPARAFSPSESTVTDKRRKRRVSHNLVERRRRDQINQAIADLSHLIPTVMLEPAPGATALTHHHVHSSLQIANSPTFAVDEFGSPTAGGAVLKPNKGLVLERSVDYIKLLQQQVQALTDSCQSLKEQVTRLGGNPDGLVSLSSEASDLHRRDSTAASESSNDALGIDIESAISAHGMGDYMEH